MTALYALPDHQVVSQLLPGIDTRHLDNEDALARIAQTKGLIPVAIDPQSETGGNGRVFWADIGDHPLREWQHIFTIQTLTQKGLVGESFSTDFSILRDDRVATQSLRPRGFIFHISRCGSTLMGKALARSSRHLVINQAAPLQRGFWATLTRDWTRPLEASEENLQAFRNLVLALTRRRENEQSHAFIKFISWNSLYMDFVMQAFDETPALFLYREPVEVIASVLRETSAVLWAKGRRQAGFLSGLDWQETTDMADVEYLAHCFANYLRHAAGMADQVGLLNYTDIKPGNLADILRRGFRFVPDAAEIDLMTEQFRFHSKDDSNKQSFEEDSERKRGSIAPEDQELVDRICGGLVDALDRSGANLYPRSSGLACQGNYRYGNLRVSGRGEASSPYKLKKWQRH